MSVRTIAEIVFLAISIAGAALTAFGLLRSRDALGATHCVSFASIAIPVPLFLAVVVAKLDAMASLKALFLLLVVLVGGPIASHAMGRAIYHRSHR